jgi:hypothetical protein
MLTVAVFVCALALALMVVAAAFSIGQAYNELRRIDADIARARAARGES